jgi:hypothetical protein
VLARPVFIVQESVCHAAMQILFRREGNSMIFRREILDRTF